MEDRRQHDRNRVFAAVTITYGDRCATIHSVVRDLSGMGARLLVDEPQRAPRDMELTFARGGLLRRARVVWRGAAEVGVVFAPDISPAAPAPSATIVSLAEVRRARLQESDAERLAARVARIARPPPRPRPEWIDLSRMAWGNPRHPASLHLEIEQGSVGLPTQPCLASPDGERRRTTALVPPQTTV